MFWLSAEVYNEYSTYNSHRKLLVNKPRSITHVRRVLQILASPVDFSFSF